MPRTLRTLAFAALSVAVATVPGRSQSAPAEPVAETPAPATGTQTPTPTAETGSSAEEFQLPDPVAKVGGVEISAETVRDLALSSLPSPEMLSRMPVAQQRQLYARALDAVIADRLVTEASRVIKLEKADIDKQIQQIAQQVGSAEELETQLKTEGRTMADLRKAVEASLQQERWLEPQVAAKAQISEEEVAEFYKSEPRASQAPEAVRASHILILTPPEAGEVETQKALERIQTVRRKIIEGEPFEIMAKEYSEDPGSKDKGGDLNFFTRGQMVREFEDAAFSLPVGDVSGPIKTNFGYHLIKVTEKKDARTIPLEEATPSIVAYLQGAKRRAAVADIVTELREKSEMEIYLK